MKCSDEKWRPVAFISKSLSDTEWNCKGTSRVTLSKF